MDIIRLWWSDESSVKYVGEHYQQTGPKPGPKPAHEVGIWLGAYGPRMLDLVGRKADGWVPSLGNLTMEKLSSASDRIDRAAVAADRDPSSINRVLNLWGDKTTAEWVAMLIDLVEVGFNGFLFGGGPGDVQRVAEEIAPTVRQAVGRA